MHTSDRCLIAECSWVITLISLVIRYKGPWKTYLVLELEGLSSGDIDRTTAVRATLLLILLLGESLAASNRQVLVGPVCISVGHVCVRGMVVWQLAQGGERGLAGTGMLLSRVISRGRACVR